MVLLDFGLSTEVEERADPETTDGHIVGTVTYMAPEQAAGCSVTAASDWYAVGVMLYRALTGRLPHAGKVLEILMEKQRTDPPRPRDAVRRMSLKSSTGCAWICWSETPASVRRGRRSCDGWAGSPVEASRLAAQRRLFVGRESQLAALNAAFADMCQGQTVTVFVHGRSGVGKSSLIQRFLEGLFERGEAVILAGRCYEQESVAYKAVDTLIDSLSRYLRRLSRREADALMPRDVSTLAQVFPVLRRVEAVAEAPLRAARRFRTNSSCGGGRSPPCASCSRGSATGGRSCWRSTISSGVTSTAHSCCRTCCARPIRRCSSWLARTGANTRRSAPSCACCCSQRAMARLPAITAKSPSSR